DVFWKTEDIPEQMRRLFRKVRDADYLRELNAPAFATDAAAFLAELNAIHPFREGNGRTQTTFLAALAARAGHPVNLADLNEDLYLQAMIRSFHGDEVPLRDQLLALIS
ncbi:Fic family protein, partial [Phenylobacterium sp.]|uniref:Fic family protein n=1 Tax=Phenylobacterium sp. TaxID=1871053 RepID=UPI0039835FC3